MRTGFFEVAASAIGDPQVCSSIYAPVAPRPGVPILRNGLDYPRTPTPVTLGLTEGRPPGAAAPQLYQARR